ncbi:MAG: aminotransferase class V-fold PLP-dependent enzyme [Undibacterium sp.]
MFDPKNIRQDFPIFESQPTIVYLDSAATALKPKAVIDVMNEYYFEYSANVARGLYPLAEGATNALEAARKTVARFVNAETTESVVFTANATHSINLVALGLEHLIGPKKNIIVTELEHHSNYLPWKELAHRSGAEFRIARFDTDGMIDESHLASLIDEETSMVAFSAVSNVFGVINPVKAIIQAIRKKNPKALVLIDACQAAGHIPINLSDWDADFIVFSGHKLFGPTGIGILAGKQKSLEALVPMNVGGGTVLDACSAKTEFKKLPENLEGGTPNIAGAIGLARAIEYVETLSLENIHHHETALTQYTLAELHSAFGERLHILGTEDAEKQTGIISFALDGIHPHDLAHLLGEENICVRAGEHCASPLHHAAHLSATTRISLSIYNTETDIDQLVIAMKKIHSVFALSDL